MLTPVDADPNATEWIAKNWVVDPAADPAFLVPYVPETAHVRLGTWIGATKALLATDNTDRLKGLKSRRSSSGRRRIISFSTIRTKRRSNESWPRQRSRTARATIGSNTAFCRCRNRERKSPTSAITCSGPRRTPLLPTSSHSSRRARRPRISPTATRHRVLATS
jgi:hypothetical protein